MANGGPGKILDSLRENSKNDENVSRFLVEIFNKELIQGNSHWKKQYIKSLNKYTKPKKGVKNAD